MNLVLTAMIAIVSVPRRTWSFVVARFRTRRREKVASALLVLVVLVGFVSWALLGGGPTGRSASGNASQPAPSTPGAPPFQTPGGAGPAVGAYDAVTCSSATSCLAVGADAAGGGVAATSSDGGSSWQSHAVPASTPELDAVACPSTSHCVAVGAHSALTTSDGGNTWAPHVVPDSAVTLLGVACANGNDCVASGIVAGAGNPYGGKLFSSTDGGTTWSMASVVAPDAPLAGVTCPTASRCIAVGDTVLTSDDAGRTWQQRTVDGGMGWLRSVTCSTALACIAVGPNAEGSVDPTAAADAIATSDGGDTWHQMALPAGTAPIERISCGNAQACVAAGPGLTPQQAPAYVSSGDGGGHWGPAASPNGMTAIADVACVSSTHCLAVGRGGSGAETSVTSDGHTWTTSQAAQA